jgi:hypothetical protein
MSAFTTVDAYIQAQEPWKKEILHNLRLIIKDVASATKESIKWAQPIYEDEQGPFCYMRAHKNHVTLGFWRGAIMNDPTGILLGDGEKMRHIKITRETSINRVVIVDFIKQAIELNKKLGNPSR